MNDEELIAQQLELQKQAYDVLDSLNLIPFLSCYGQPKIVGSLALGLMTWRDIDIDLEVPGVIKDRDFWRTAKYLLGCDGITLITLVDNRNMIEKNRSKSMYIGGKYQTNDEYTWKIDLRFVAEQDAIAQKYIDRIHSELTDDKRKIILSIKQVIAQHPGYRFDIASVDIYEAVLTKGVTDLESFKAYMKTSGT